jgi:hypothetical protein
MDGGGAGLLAIELKGASDASILTFTISVFFAVTMTD